VRDDDLRLPAHALRLLDGVDERGDVVAVAFEDVPVERAVLVGERLERHHVLGAAVDLDHVAVDDAGEIVELELGGGHHRLPMEAALVLAVARDDVGAVVLAVHLRRERHPGALREPFAERSGRRFEPRQADALGVALEARPELAQRQQLLDREVAGVRHRAVADRRDVPAREQQPVAVGPVRVLRVVPHQMEVQRGEDVGHVERAARMTGPRCDQRADDADPNVVRVQLQLGEAFRRE
jgi:hypothetical protein